MHTLTTNLHVGLHNALITASRDETIPSINAIEIRSDGKQLVLASTDRYRLGLSRVKLDEGGGKWRFLLKLRDADVLVKALKTVKRDSQWRSATIEFKAEASGLSEKDTLTVKLNSGESFTFDGHESDFPKTRQLFPDNGSGTEEHMTGFTLDYLAAFGKVISDSTRMTLRHFGKDKPRVITVGTDYVGLIMPTKDVADEHDWKAPDWIKG